MKNNGGDRIGRWQLLLRALRYRNYRLFFLGQSVSLVGTWMQQVAMSWLVYRLTGSAVLLGVIGFVGQLPTFLFAPFAGVLADRWDRRELVLCTQALAMLQAAILALIVVTGMVEVWHVIALASFLGVISAFDVPVRQSFVIDMVEDKESLGNAIALNSSMVNGARLIGPSVAGLLIASLGEGVCFILNAFSYLAVIVAVAAMRIRPAQPHGARKDLLRELKEGVEYAAGFKPIWAILLLIGVLSLMGMPYSVLMPVFAKDLLHGGAHTYGFLMGATGLGAFVSTIFLASRRSVLGLGRFMWSCACVFGIGVAAFAMSRSLILSLLCLLVAGFGVMTVIASGNTVLQTIVDDDKRGRVMSFYTMAFMGTTPFGSLFAGVVAGRIGATATLLIGAGACFVAGLLYARHLPAIREQVRPIYRRIGVIPEMTPTDLVTPPEKR
ncbi:MFS transporter [Geomonas sp. RF6]|uniref:MFS transporter n=1 Tax=Geomonas sp. RF6 TaxID=2897342 RepID=UPI001E6243C4|nr:MFS transporter [Geomonas sp. RF6]UFS68794.1 MFS transporter [Geomonas sp. RF6]